jgi:predicted Ser/Thr protein kinase
MTGSHALIGQTVSHYRILEKLGRGGMGVVYRAEDTRLHRNVALKFLPDNLAKDPHSLTRFRREACAASALNHPNICTIYDVGETDGRAFIAMEFLDGMNLKTVINRRPIEKERLVQISIEVARALEAAHAQGIIHRDIKPANIFILTSGGTKLLDFGLAKLLSLTAVASSSVTSELDETAPFSTASGLLVGTVDYMAPEQLQGGPLDPRTDLFALGLVLYEMATGANPFVGTSASSTIANILKDVPVSVIHRNPSIPVCVEAIIQKCLRKDPNERYPSARAVLDDLTQIPIRSQKVTATQPVQAVGDAPLQVSRLIARSLFMLVQVGYLIMYGAALYKFHEVLQVSIQLFGSFAFGMLILVDATVGTPLCIYLFTALLFDFAYIGKQFRAIFPAVLILDLLWASTPLLFLGQLQGLVILCSGALAFLPLSQKTLLYEAYARTGGRSSGIRADSRPSS